MQILLGKQAGELSAIRKKKGVVHEMLEDIVHGSRKESRGVKGGRPLGPEGKRSAAS